MALWFPIMVNAFKIGEIELVRVDPVNHKPAENEMCTYKLKYFGKTVDDMTPLVFEGLITHPYISNNPLPLIQKALEQINGTTS